MIQEFYSVAPQVFTQETIDRLVDHHLESRHTLGLPINDAEVDSYRDEYLQDRQVINQHNMDEAFNCREAEFAKLRGEWAIAKSGHR